MAKRRQCAKCPWKVSTDPREIPNGYSADLHRALTCTIAKQPAGEMRLGGDLHLMACHESQFGREVPCVGWLDNQLGPGNNLKLRYALILGRVSTDYELDGEQHESLEATFPDD